jgi:folate-binding protein YgfZ
MGALLRNKVHVVSITGVAASGIPLAGLLALEALRIAVWRPRFATEVDEKTIPHELDWLRTAVHLSKGCYRGQETVAKVHNLGYPPRRLVMLYLDGSNTVLPSGGDEVVLDEKTVGHVTSAARH